MEIHIRADISDDSLFGAEDAPEDYDITTLNDAILAATKAHFPHAEITLETNDYQTLVEVNHEWTTDAEIVVQIIHDEWQKWLGALE